MKIRNLLAASAAVAGLGACGQKPISEEVFSCQSDLLTASVDFTDYGRTVSINLFDHSARDRFYSRENLIIGENREEIAAPLQQQAVAFCKTGELPENSGILYESEKLLSYECRGESDNIARATVYDSTPVLLTGNLAERTGEASETPERREGYTSRKVNVFTFAESIEEARAHCAAPAISTP